MKPSTASHIAYDLRPAKQAERRILLDFLKCANQAGVNISDCRYVGLGGIKFYDFHLVYRFLGIKEMVSLERDPKIFARAEFNRPYDSIKLKESTVAEFLIADKHDAPSVFWFDYDDGLSEAITADIHALGARMKIGGFAFVTVLADPLRHLQKQSPKERLAVFQEQFGDFSSGLTPDDMSDTAFARTIYRILIAAFKHAFYARVDGEFTPWFQVQYKDTTTMVTVGGCYCRKDESLKIRDRLQVDLPFLLNSEPYKIKNLNITERERALFDRAVTSRNSSSPEAEKLQELGFGSREFDTYRDLIRFLPRYHESMI